MTTHFRLNRADHALHDAAGRRFDPLTRTWSAPPAGGAGLPEPEGETVDVALALRWLQRGSQHPLRIPVGVVGPSEATLPQLAAAERIGAGLADLGLFVLSGGMRGVTQAVCEGVKRNGGISIGLLAEDTPEGANDYLRIILATGLGEARNAVIARAAFCVIAIGDSLGTVSEVALALRFGKPVIGLEGAAGLAGVRHVGTTDAALQAVAACVLGLDPGADPGGRALP